MQKNKSSFKPYTDQPPFNNIPCGPDEVLAPVVAAGDMKDMLKIRGLDEKNIRTWTLCHGKTVPVALIQVHKSELENAKKLYDQQVKKYLKGEKNPYLGMLSIEELQEKAASKDFKGIDLTADSHFEDNYQTLELLHELMDDLEKHGEGYGEIFELLFDNATDRSYSVKDLLEEIHYPGKKTKGYELVRKVRKLAERIYERKYR